MNMSSVQPVAKFTPASPAPSIMRLATVSASAPAFLSPAMDAASANASAPARLVSRNGSAMAGVRPLVKASMSFSAFSRHFASPVNADKRSWPDHASAGM